MKKREKNLPPSKRTFLKELLYANLYSSVNQNFQTVVAQFPVSPSPGPNPERPTDPAEVRVVLRAPDCTAYRYSHYLILCLTSLNRRAQCYTHSPFLFVFFLMVSRREFSGPRAVTRRRPRSFRVRGA